MTDLNANFGRGDEVLEFRHKHTDLIRSTCARVAAVAQQPLLIMLEVACYLLVATAEPAPLAILQRSVLRSLAKVCVPVPTASEGGLLSRVSLLTAIYGCNLPDRGGFLSYLGLALSQYFGPTATLIDTDDWGRVLGVICGEISAPAPPVCIHMMCKTPNGNGAKERTKKKTRQATAVAKLGANIMAHTTAIVQLPTQPLTEVAKRHIFESYVKKQPCWQTFPTFGGAGCAELCALVLSASDLWGRLTALLGTEFFAEIRECKPYKTAKAPGAKGRALRYLLFAYSWGCLCDPSCPQPVFQSLTRARGGVGGNKTANDARGMSFSQHKHSHGREFDVVTIELNDALYRQQPKLTDFVSVMHSDRNRLAVVEATAIGLCSAVTETLGAIYGRKKVSDMFRGCSTMVLRSAVSFHRYLQDGKPTLTVSDTSDDANGDAADDNDSDVADEGATDNTPESADGDDKLPRGYTVADSFHECLFRYALLLTEQGPTANLPTTQQCFRAPFDLEDSGPTILAKLQELAKEEDIGPNLKTEIMAVLASKDLAKSIRALRSKIQRDKVLFDELCNLYPVIDHTQTLGDDIALPPLATMAHALALALGRLRSYPVAHNFFGALDRAVTSAGSRTLSPLPAATVKDRSRDFSSRRKRGTYDLASQQSLLLDGAIPYLVLLDIAEEACVDNPGGNHAMECLAVARACVSSMPYGPAPYRKLFFGDSPNCVAWHTKYKVADRLVAARASLQQVYKGLPSELAGGSVGHTLELIAALQSFISHREDALPGPSLSRRALARSELNATLFRLRIRLPNAATCEPPMVSPLSDSAVVFNWVYVAKRLDDLNYNESRISATYADCLDSTRWREAVVAEFFGAEYHRQAYHGGATIVSFVFGGHCVQLRRARHKAGPPLAPTAIAITGTSDDPWIQQLVVTPFNELANFISNTQKNYENLSSRQKLALSNYIFALMGIDANSPGLYHDVRLHHPLFSSGNIIPAAGIDAHLHLVRKVFNYDRRFRIGADPGYKSCLVFADAGLVADRACAMIDKRCPGHGGPANVKSMPVKKFEAYKPRKFTGAVHTLSFDFKELETVFGTDTGTKIEHRACDQLYGPVVLRPSHGGRLQIGDMILRFDAYQMVYSTERSAEDALGRARRLFKEKPRASATTYAECLAAEKEAFAQQPVGDAAAAATKTNSSKHKPLPSPPWHLPLAPFARNPLTSSSSAQRFTIRFFRPPGDKSLHPAPMPVEKETTYAALSISQQCARETLGIDGIARCEKKTRFNSLEC